MIVLFISEATWYGTGRFLEQDVQASRETMELNYFGTLRTVKAFLPGMVNKGHGEVVLVSSAAAVCGRLLHSSATLQIRKHCLSTLPSQYRRVQWLGPLC